MKGFDYYWYRRGLMAYVLWPLSLLYCAVAALRRMLYRLRNVFWPRPKAAVVVVGNISVGGTGKTPMVIWLAGHLKANGLRPGIVSRGYGGKAQTWPQAVDADSDPIQVGDEPVLIAARSACPVYVAPKRNLAVKALLGAHDCNVIISDDGMQHYAMQRDIEIAMVDSKRRFGNGFCLPAGPLREPVRRLRRSDFVVVNGLAKKGEHAMGLRGAIAMNLGDPSLTQPLEGFRHQAVHAVAGIGNPSRFFDMLSVNGIQVREHPFADHHRFSAEDIAFDDELPILMTEKDAVKCKAFASARLWVVPVSAMVDKSFASRLTADIKAAVAKRYKRKKRRG